VVVPAASSGYLQAIAPAPLIETATRHDLVVRLAKRVGDHVVAGTPIAWAWHHSPDRPSPEPALLAEAVADAVQVGFERTMVQDVLFGLRRLVDIANRALSPAVNDPYTAIQAVHHLSVLLCVLARRRLGDWLCRDRDGTLRVAVPLPDFAEYLRRSTAQIRRFGAAEPALTRSLIELLRDVGTSTASGERRAACAHHLWLVLEDAKREPPSQTTSQAVVEDGAAALSTLGADHPPGSGGPGA
jgi:uncharacterized membrane protein